MVRPFADHREIRPSGLQSARARVAQLSTFPMSCAVLRSVEVSLLSKVLWIGDGGCNTGFGRVTHAIGERLVTQYGHEVRCLATNYKGDPFPSVENLSPMTLLVPTLYVNGDFYGQSRYLELLRDYNPDVVIMLNDPQVMLRLLLENAYDSEQLLRQYRPIIAYLAVDGHNHPPTWSMLNEMTNVVAMSKFGQGFFPNSKMVYHGIDTDLFWPVDSQHPITISNGDVLRSKKECKAAMGFPTDAFVVGRVDRNSGRKDYPATWKALLPVMHRHSDVIAYYHTKIQNDESGIDLLSIWSRDAETASRQRFPDSLNPYHGFKQQDLNALYNSFDLFVSTSRGEGFGLTIAEAMACGVPVIAQNVSAIPEVVGPGGKLIDPQREVTVPFGHDQWLSDVDAFSEAIEYAYLHRRWRRETGKAGREHVVRSFQWDAAAASFNEYVTLLSGEAKEESEHAADEPVSESGG